jgi:hypothetical protein
MCIRFKKFSFRCGSHVPEITMQKNMLMNIINWVLIWLDLGSHSGVKKMLVITDWLFIQALGPCRLNMKLTQVDPLGVLEAQF